MARQRQIVMNDPMQREMDLGFLAQFPLTPQGRIAEEELRPEDEVEDQRRVRYEKPKRKRRIKVTPGEIWNEYTNGQMFNDAQELSQRIEKAENFFIGDQWKGVNAPDMDKPVFTRC